MRTPRFRTSSHVLVFVFADGQREPCRVVKTPRRAGERRFLDREAERLRAVHAARPEGWSSIPRLVAYAEWKARPLLVQSFLAGRTMSPAYVRRHRRACIESGIDWLVEMHAATHHRLEEPGAAHLDGPLRPLESLFTSDSASQHLSRRTLQLVEAGAIAALPRVFEHGDLGSPNVLVDARGRIAVVDWELAEAHGLPAADLFFFLNYVAGACAAARRPEDVRRAFQAAFFGPDAWTVPYVRRYAEAVRLPSDSLKPLFLLTWARVVVNVAARLGGGHAPGIDSESSPSSPTLPEDRYFILWQHALEHASELVF